MLGIMLKIIFALIELAIISLCVVKIADAISHLRKYKRKK